MLAGLDIAGDDGGGMARAQHRAVGHDDLQRHQAAGVERDVVVDQRAEDVERGGVAIDRGALKLLEQLRRRTGEVERRVAADAVDAGSRRG